MNNTEINKFAEEKGINRYELVIATAKCARMITDDFILQKVLEERVEGKDLDKPIPILISDEYKDEQPVQSAVELLTDGEFWIVEDTLPENEDKKSEN